MLLFRIQVKRVAAVLYHNQDVWKHQPGGKDLDMRRLCRVAGDYRRAVEPAEPRHKPQEVAGRPHKVTNESRDYYRPREGVSVRRQEALEYWISLEAEHQAKQKTSPHVGRNSTRTDCLFCLVARRVLQDDHWKDQYQVFSNNFNYSVPPDAYKNHKPRCRDSECPNFDTFTTS